MEIKPKDMCPRCKYYLGMTPQGMYSCGKTDSELNIGIDVILNFANFERKDGKVEGRYPWGSDEDKVLKYCANDVIIIAELMAKEKQKELEDKISAYEKIFNDILNEVYEHPEMFDRNMTAYELLPGRVKFLKNSWDMMCDKYDPLNVENEQRKKAMDNQAKMIQDLKKERDELTEKLKNVDISKVPKLEARIKNLEYLNEESYKREEELEKELNKVKAHDKALTKHFQNDEKLIDNIQKVIFPQEEGSDYTYGYEEILNKVEELKKSEGNWMGRYYDIRFALRKDEVLDDSISCPRDIPSDVELMEDLKKKAADSYYYKKKSELLEERNNNQFDTIREKNKKIEELTRRYNMIAKKLNDIHDILKEESDDE